MDNDDIEISAHISGPANLQVNFDAYFSLTDFSRAFVTPLGLCAYTFLFICSTILINPMNCILYIVCRAFDIN